MVIQIVRFRSRLSSREVLQIYEARAPQYRALPGLLQKYYLRFPATGEHGAVYLWDTQEALTRFRQSDLAGSIPEAYQIQGGTDVQVW